MRSLDRRRIPNLDEPYRSRFEALRPPLVFIVGLHRSGTSFLYDALRTILPMAAVEVRHVVFFPRLVHDSVRGLQAERRRELSDYFRNHGMERRLMDEISLGPQTVEEYGWVLRRYGGGFRLTSRTRPVFDDLVRKVAFLRPDARGVLVKNPWDTRQVPYIAGSFPDARFVFIRRDPLWILDSQLRNAVLFGADRNPLLYLLLNGIPLGKAVVGAQRLLFRLAGDRVYRRTMARMLARDVRMQRGYYDGALRALSPERYVEIDDSELAEDVRGTLRRVGSFLELPVGEALRDVRFRRRERAIAPEVEALSDMLRVDS